LQYSRAIIRGEVELKRPWEYEVYASAFGRTDYKLKNQDYGGLSLCNKQTLNLYIQPLNVRWYIFELARIQSCMRLLTEYSVSIHFIASTAIIWWKEKCTYIYCHVIEWP
jgi:hypothetical protein